MHLSFRQGIVRYQTPTFLSIGGSYVSLVVNDIPCIITLADGPKDYLYVEQTSVSNAWGPITPAVDQWLFWDIDRRTGVRTFGITLVQPVAQPSEPPSPAVDQHWFDTSVKQMKVWNGTRWLERIRVFACELSNGSVPISMSINSPLFDGTQAGLTVADNFAGQILFDANTGQPLKTPDHKFITTEDRLTTRTISLSDIKVAALVLEAEAQQNMAAYTVVQFTDFNEITFADAFTASQLSQFGIIEKDVLVGDFTQVTLEGVITNPTWDWPTVNAPLYSDSTGQLVTVAPGPNSGAVAMVVGRQSIIFGSPKNTFNTFDVIVGLATAVDHGLVRLNIPPVSALDPVVIGANDPRLVLLNSLTGAANQIVYGTGTGVDSSSTLTYNVSTGAFSLSPAANATPGTVSINPADAGAGGGNGASFVVTAGTGDLTDVGNGGNIQLSGGPAGDQGNGGDVSLAGGNGGPSGGDGGDVTLISGAGTTISGAAGVMVGGVGGGVILQTGSGGGATNTATGASSASGGQGLDLQISGGFGGASALSNAGATGTSFGGNGSTVTITSGSGGSSTHAGAAGSSNGGFGGGITLTAGNGGTATGGAVNTDGDGGTIQITAGSSGDGAGGLLMLTAGNSTTGADGYINFTTAATERLKIRGDGGWEIGGSQGTVGQVLTSSGAGTPPTWQPGGGSAAPLNQIVYGTGAGVTSNATFKFDPTGSGGGTAAVFVGVENDEGTVQGFNATTLNFSGGAINLIGGAGNGTGGGGGVAISGGTAASGPGGGVTIMGGIVGTDGDGGSILIVGTSGTGTDRTGGTVDITSGNGTGIGNPGDINLTAGSADATASSTGGNIYLVGGVSGNLLGSQGGQVSMNGGSAGTLGVGGAATVYGGSAIDGNGGEAILKAGDATGTGNGGMVTVQGGIAFTGGTGGMVFIDAGMGFGGGTNASILMRTSALPRLEILADGDWSVGGLSGTSGQVLTSNGLGTPPTWTTPASAVEPANQIVYGTGAGVDSSSLFTYTPTTGQFVVDGGSIVSGTPGSVSIAAAWGVGVTGGSASLYGGNAIGGGDGGEVRLQSGNATAGNGGPIYILARETTSATGTGGVVSMRGGDAFTAGGDGGSVSIGGGFNIAGGAGGSGGGIDLGAGFGSGAGNSGGTISISAGEAQSGAAAAGVVTITAGASSVAAVAGGAVTISGGGTSGAASTAGGVTVQGGTPSDGNGGAISITGSAGVGTNRSGGNVTITAGAATGTGEPGTIVLASRYAERRSAPSISANTLTVNMANGNHFGPITLNANITTLTISNVPTTALTTIVLTLTFVADGTLRTITWPASFKWPGGTAPTMTSTLSKVDVITATSYDNGTSWLATFAQNF